MDQAHPQRRPGIVVDKVDDQTVLYDENGGALHVLNPTSAMIWELCDGERTVADIDGALRGRFAVPDDRDVRADVLRVLGELAAKGLLVGDSG